jgi:diacylglycerol O-acyltransferase
MRRLSGIDADMIYGETPQWHLHVGALLILDGSTAPGGFGFDRWSARLEHLVEEVPALRERLVEVPFGLDRPLWVEDAGVDLGAHLRRVAVPSPGGERELATVVGDLLERKLDRSRPLWDMSFIEGLRDGRVAVLARIHHAAVDGVGGALLLGRLFDTEPEPRRAPASPRVAEPAPSRAALLAGAAPSVASVPLRAARTVGKTASSLLEALRVWRSGRTGPMALPFQAPRTSFNRPVSRRRSFAFVSVPLADAKRVTSAFGVKLNDVVLAVCAGALRRYLQERAELPDAPLVAAVPVSVRTEEDLLTPGNMVSGMFTSLATHLDDPVERLIAIRDAANNAKELYASGVEDAVMDWASVLPPAAVPLGVRLYTCTHLSERMPPAFNLLVSDVPGPPMPLYAAGARLVAVYPFGPVLDSIGINITVLSYTDSVGFGLMTCPDLVPDPWLLAGGIRPSLAELAQASRRSP